MSNSANLETPTQAQFSGRLRMVDWYLSSSPISWLALGQVADKKMWAILTLPVERQFPSMEAPGTPSIVDEKCDLPVWRR